MRLLSSLSIWRIVRCLHFTVGHQTIMLIKICVAGSMLLQTKSDVVFSGKPPNSEYKYGCKVQRASSSFLQIFLNFVWFGLVLCLTATKLRFSHDGGLAGCEVVIIHKGLLRPARVANQARPSPSLLTNCHWWSCFSPYLMMHSAVIPFLMHFVNKQTNKQNIKQQIQVQKGWSRLG